MLEVLFDNDDGSCRTWSGSFLKTDGIEFVGFRVHNLRYVCQFMAPSTLGDDSFLDEYSRNCLNCYKPDESSRVIKFHRLEATGQGGCFDPSKWPIPQGTSPVPIFRVLQQCISAHVSTFTNVMQYYYIPSTEKLEKTYSKLYTALIKKDASLGNFLPIGARPQDMGGFYGYQRY